MGWYWFVGGLIAWVAVALVVAVVLGRAIRLADASSPGTGVAPAAPRAAAEPRRGWVPLPAVGIVLVVVALGLETAGYVTRLTGGTGQVSQLLSMDAPGSVPRLFVAGLFAVAAAAALAGAGVQRGRRSWWTAVALVAGSIAVVKAGGTLHSDALSEVRSAVGDTGALGISALLAAVVVGGLWWLSRTERRDRRRLLSALSFYGVAVVGLSAVSSAVTGPTWSAAATYLEETGEALAGVAFLMAVLVGVAPQLVLPRTWALRRTADAELAGQPQPGSRPATY